MDESTKVEYKGGGKTNLFLEVVSLTWKLKSFRDERKLQRRQPRLGSEAPSAGKVVHLLVWLEVTPCLHW